MRRVSSVAAASAVSMAWLISAAAAQPVPPRPPRPQTPVTVTFTGACGGAWRDTVDRTAECPRTQRPVCYSNGACRCEDDSRCR